MSSSAASKAQCCGCSRKKAADEATATRGETQAAPANGDSVGKATNKKKPSLYRRELPCPPAIAFESEQGQKMFAEALAEGQMKCFFPLIAQFATQAEPAYCGLTSLVVVLNALKVDPGSTWKGPWRFYAEEKLDCCEPLERVKQKGVTVAQLACLAQCNHLAVETYGCRGDMVPSVDTMRKVIATTVGRTDKLMIASYSRKHLLQTGDGHFSPIGGYHDASDHVLILDVARFKYPPHWVPLQMLHEAMFHYSDSSTGRPRGLMLLSKQCDDKEQASFGVLSLHGNVLDYTDAISAFVRGEMSIKELLAKHLREPVVVPLSPSNFVCGSAEANCTGATEPLNVRLTAVKDQLQLVSTLIDGQGDQAAFPGQEMLATVAWLIHLAAHEGQAPEAAQNMALGAELQLELERVCRQYALLTNMSSSCWRFDKANKT